MLERHSIKFVFQDFAARCHIKALPVAENGARAAPPANKHVLGGPCSRLLAAGITGREEKWGKEGKKNQKSFHVSLLSDDGVCIAGDSSPQLWRKYGGGM